jgi:DNA-directed RNA polymerase specialized sigma24 family protein
MARVAVLDKDDEARRRYEAALAKLPDAERAAVLYRLRDELSYQTIADKLGLPSPDGARLAVQRAMLHLATVMSQPAEGPFRRWLGTLRRRGRPDPGPH